MEKKKKKGGEGGGGTMKQLERGGETGVKCFCDCNLTNILLGEKKRKKKKKGGGGGGGYHETIRKRRRDQTEMFLSVRTSVACG